MNISQKVLGGGILSFYSHCRPDRRHFEYHDLYADYNNNIVIMYALLCMEDMEYYFRTFCQSQTVMSRVITTVAFWL